MAMTGNADSERITFLCGDGLKTTTSIFKVAYLSTNMGVCIASAATDQVIGIIDSMQSAGSDNVSVIVGGVAKGTMQSLTACTYGQWLVADTNGTLDVFGTNTAQQNIVGKALATPATGGSVSILVRLSPFGIID